MTRRDYIIRLLEIKGKPIKLIYTNADITRLVMLVENIKKYLEVISQGVEGTGHIERQLLEKLIRKTDKALEHVLNNFHTERKNRKMLIEEAKRRIEGIL